MLTGRIKNQYAGMLNQILHKMLDNVRN